MVAYGNAAHAGQRSTLGVVYFRVAVFVFIVSTTNLRAEFAMPTSEDDARAAGAAASDAPESAADIVTTFLDERFNQLKSHCDYFDSLYDIGDLKNAPPDSLNTKCRNLTAILQDHESSDVDALELREELKVLSTLLKPGIGPKETLKFIGRHNFCRNVNIALRILLTLPVTVASGERGFSKLKLIKTYLRSTMSQTRLNDLATISIEHELAEDLNYRDRVKELAQTKARKVRLV
ncbi:uncharacterized protein LOC124722670 [Schistocerca piceifrons]|uniref:uncharacterized protein LOC124722670 n=1 Tax=Schistocerca piceifrons TaxID=274613 RepID=UPI001F5F6B06|nr:uncharacterized protein LOC124722670 [Schistocerca piceifrons]